ncbi:hypothetical protein B0H13DRAFT_2274707 [Mycena leptocephala]|nr:hypothetical protein B0H13DRAFT_2274707 [Mycena leptocephala]
MEKYAGTIVTPNSARCEKQGVYAGARQTHIVQRTIDPIESNGKMKKERRNVHDERGDGVPSSERRAVSLARAALARSVSFEGADTPVRPMRHPCSPFLRLRRRHKPRTREKKYAYPNPESDSASQPPPTCEHARPYPKSYASLHLLIERPMRERRRRLHLPLACRAILELRVHLDFFITISDGINICTEMRECAVAILFSTSRVDIKRTPAPSERVFTFIDRRAKFASARWWSHKKHGVRREPLAVRRPRAWQGRMLEVPRSGSVCRGEPETNQEPGTRARRRCAQQRIPVRARKECGICLHAGWKEGIDLGCIDRPMRSAMEAGRCHTGGGGTLNKPDSTIEGGDGRARTEWHLNEMDSEADVNGEISTLSRAWIRKPRCTTSCTVCAVDTVGIETAILRMRVVAVVDL